MRKQRIKADFRGRASAWLFLACALLACLIGVTARPAFLLDQWRPLAGFPAGYDLAPEDPPRLAEALARALAGDVEALRLRVGQGIRERAAFQAHEIAHMSDVAALYRLARIIAWGCGLASLALALWIWRRPARGGLAAPAKGALLGVADALALIVILAAWAAIDFRSVFLLFHRLAFTNDLWLLDPNTDLLIQLMPQWFFERAVARIALWWLGCALLWSLGAWALRRAARRHTAREDGDEHLL
jgi:integral membrane protein (TIGR01906 family)